MELERYELEVGENYASFEFVSEGVEGKIIKVVQFQPMRLPGFYNLSLGDKNKETGEIDDMVISNNGDTEKVLATVVKALYVFLSENEDIWVYPTGSTKVRTRLYRMGINKYLDMVQRDFNIIGELQNKWKRYEKNTEYQAFTVQKKLK